jgi:glucose/arabinose dehydrogenase
MRATRAWTLASVPFALLLVLGGCEAEQTDVPTAELEEEAEPTQQQGQQQAQEFVADLSAVNEQLTGPITGQARVTVEDGEVVLELNAEGVPPNMMHLQHTHGLTDGGTARCPGSGADENSDGVIDLVEAEASTGTTMIPFHDDPASMEIKAETYPTAHDAGRLVYQHRVPVDELEQAFTGKFEGQEFDWGRRVVMVHGVPQDADLPDSAQSLPDVPAHVTLPIACGELRPRR